MNEASPSPLACIIIPVHNRRTLTLACLECLRWCAGAADWKIILVDDGSTDGTADAVRATFPQVNIITGTGSLFWTGAMALGMKHAMTLGATEIVWLNDDTLPDEAPLRRIVRLVRQDPVLMVSSTPVADGRPLVFSSLNFKPAPSVPGTLQEADVLAGFQVAFSAEVVRRIGLPDAHTWPHYAGDSSYTRQAHQAGFRLRVDGDSYIQLTSFEPYPSVADIFWRGNRILSARVQDIFFSPQSKFRLATFWHLDILSRGLLRTLIVFPGRFAAWCWHIWRHRPLPETSAPLLDHRANPSSPS